MSFWSDVGRGALAWGTLGVSEGFFGARDNVTAQQEANATNIAEAQKNRDFQERMSSTAYQRAMSDMKSAGLNPMLAFSQGGASSPSGSVATVQSDRRGDPALAASDAGMKMAKTAAEIASISLPSAQADQATTQAELNAVSSKVRATEIKKNTATAKETEANTRAIEAQERVTNERLKAVRRENALKEKCRAADEKLQNFDAYRERVEDTLGVVGSALGVRNRARKSESDKYWEHRHSREEGEALYRNRERGVNLP